MGDLIQPSINLTKKGKSRILKVSIFLTGCAGIMAEFVLATIASYLLGDAVFQWAFTISIMLFAMGIGSRVSRYFKQDLFDIFVMIEFMLSILCSISAVSSYFLAPFVSSIQLFIYTLTFIIGLLMGMEIPLVTRMNDTYELLRVNIASVMEKDYFGALIGGLVFAFFALPRLGLTYTPVLLGSLNFIVAAMIMIKFKELIRYKKRLWGSLLFSGFFLLSTFFWIKPVILFGEQAHYLDKVVFEKRTLYQKIVITKWKNYYWLFLDGDEQFSSYDEFLYHEPLVHPAMQLSCSRKDVLILGGGDGLATREVLKYPDVKTITVVDIDPEMTKLGLSNPILTKINKNAFKNLKVKIINMDAGKFVKKSNKLYSVIIIDLPDPKSISLAKLYSFEFYKRIKKILIKGGVMVTQASSPFYSPKAFLSIYKTIKMAGYLTVAYHNNIPTMGEWGFVLGVNQSNSNKEDLIRKIESISFRDISTRFLNRDAMISMIHFGKGIFEKEKEVKINRELEPIIYRYYQQGIWELY